MTTLNRLIIFTDIIGNNRAGIININRAIKLRPELGHGNAQLCRYCFLHSERVGGAVDCLANRLRCFTDILGKSSYAVALFIKGVFSVDYVLVLGYHFDLSPLVCFREAVHFRASFTMLKTLCTILTLLSSKIFII